MKFISLCILLFLFSTVRAQWTCATATNLSAPGTFSTGTLTGSGASQVGASAARWYKFTPSTNGMLQINSCGGGSDTRLWIWSGLCNNLSAVASNDDFPNCISTGTNEYASRIQNLILLAGVTYYFEWDNYWENTGFTWSFSFTGLPNNNDIGIESVLNPYTRIPISQAPGGIQLGARLKNYAATAQTAVSLLVEVFELPNTSMPVATFTSPPQTLPVGGTVDLLAGVWAPSLSVSKTYQIKYSKTQPTLDAVATNDQQVQTLVLDYNYLARDNGSYAAAFNWSTVSDYVQATRFTINATDNLTGFRYYLQSPSSTQYYHIQLYNVQGGIIETSPFWESPAILANGAGWKDYQLPSAIVLPSGTYVMGIYKSGNSPFPVGCSTAQFRTGASFIRVGANNWNPIEAYSLQYVFMLRPKFGQDPPVDVAIIDHLNPGGNYTVVSTRQHPNGTPLNFSVRVQNNGANLASNVSLKVTVKNAAQQVIHTNTSAAVDLLAGQLDTLVLPAFMITQVGTYTVDYEIVNPGDAQPINNFVSTSFTRSTNQLAKHNGVQGGVGIGNNISSAYDNGIIGQCFQLAVADVLDSVRFVLRPGTPANQPVRVQVFATNAQGVPIGIPIAQSIVYNTSAANNATGVTLSLPFTNGPLSLAAGTYFIGITEQAGLLQLGSSSMYFQPNNTFRRWNQNPYGASSWTALEQFNQFVALAITPIFKPCLPLTISAQTQNPTCSQNNGSILLSTAGFAGQINYSWQSIAFNNSQLTNLAPGFYSCLLTDENNCQLSYTTNLVMSSTAPQLFLDSLIHLNCYGANSGQMHWSAVGGAAPYSFGIPGMAFQTSGSFLNLNAGTQAVTLIDANNCAVQQSVVLLQPPLLQLSAAELQPNLCHSDSNAVWQLSANGGVGPYNFWWPTLMEDSLIQSELPAGFYTAQVTDANACVATTVIQINAPPAIQLQQINLSNCTCPGLNNGSLSVLANGGVGAFNYIWSGTGLSGNQQTNLAPGAYEIVAQDQNGCSDTLLSNITAPPVLQLQVSTLQHPTCFGQANGSVALNTTGGTAPYTYLWQGSQDIQAAIQQLTAGSYTCMVTDANACTQQITINLLNPPALQVQLMNTISTICGQANGGLQIQYNGGSGSLNAIWSNGQTGGILQNVTAGPYTVSIHDSLGCSIVQNYVVPNINAPMLSVATQQAPSCHDATNGMLAVSVASVSPIQNISWGPASLVSSTTLTATNLSAGTYTCSVTDGNGCISSIVIPLLAPLPLDVSIQGIVNVSCAGFSNASLTLQTNGGTAPYSYDWFGLVGNSNQQSGLAAGPQSCVVTDINGCQDSIIVQITAPPVLEGQIQMLQAPTCSYSSNGVLQAQATGGTPPYAFLWPTNQQTFPILLGSSTNQQIVFVTDASGCIDTVNFLPSSLSNLVVAADVFPETCFGDQNGSISLNISGGVGSFSIIWDNGQNGSIIQNLAPALYQAVIEDDLGCVDSLLVEVTTSSNMNVSVTGTSTICAGSQNGSLLVWPNNGVAPYQLLLNGQPQSSLHPMNLTAGTYVVLVQDSLNCQDSLLFEIVESTFSVTAVATPALCLGFNNGSAFLTPMNGMAPYSFYWPGYLENTDSLIGLAGGYVTYEVTDAMNCTISDSLFIPFSEVLSLSAVISPELFGQDGAIDLQASGASAPYVYNWSNGLQTEDLSALNSGWYSVTAYDQVGCMALDSFFVASELNLATIYSDQINIYPNPFIDELVIEGAHLESVQLFDLKGAFVTAYNLSNGQQSLQLNLSSLPSGTFVLQCQQNEIARRFLVLKL